MTQQAVKFAYWVPNVSGGLVVSKVEQRTDWGIDYNRKLAQLAEEAGFEYALTQIRFTAGYGAEYQHESVAFSHALLAATSKLKVIAAKTVGIVKIDVHGEAATLQFMAKPPIDPMRIIELIQKNRHIKLHGQDKLKITAAMPDLAARVTQIKTTIKQLTV